MRIIVQIHCREILNMVTRDITTLPDPPTNAERQLALICGKIIAFNPDQLTDTSSQNIQSKAFKSYVNTQVQSLGLTHVTFDLCSGWKHPYKKLMATLFYHTFDMELRSGEYNNYYWSPDHNNYAIVTEILETYFTSLSNEYCNKQKGVDFITAQKEKQRLEAARKRLAERRQQWCDENGYFRLASQFDDPHVCSENKEYIDNSGVVKL
ncbi:hypothetical protein O181_043873 [Austropuccinia psidii MF-1]|uniref:Uncharacterized protein n=1 Tax=Austropuccinia psidii MF-1 TaxID=1389203 RepID=A0A9Q3HG48_9BASI|nr:hypothetical protein [Austropuccinia psidii MF-1]